MTAILGPCVSEHGIAGRKRREDSDKDCDEDFYSQWYHVVPVILLIQVSSVPDAA